MPPCPAQAPAPTAEATLLAPAEAAPSSTTQLVFYTAECSICLERFEEGRQAVRLNCGHLFHEECLRSWLSMRDACPYCNTAGARTAMRDVHVALVNDPARLNELNVYVARGAMQSLRLWNASLLLTKEGRELLIFIAIRRSLLRCALHRFPNAGRFVTFVLVLLAYIAADLLAEQANRILQNGLELAFDALGMMSILSGAGHVGHLVEAVLFLLVMVAMLLVCCIEARAQTVAPSTLTGEFNPENMYVVPGENAGQLAIEDTTEATVEAEIAQSKSTAASAAAVSAVAAEPAGPSGSKRTIEHAEFAGPSGSKRTSEHVSSGDEQEPVLKRRIKSASS